jgi:hypothetical protein
MEFGNIWHIAKNRNIPPAGLECTGYKVKRKAIMSECMGGVALDWREISLGKIYPSGRFQPDGEDSMEFGWDYFAFSGPQQKHTEIEGCSFEYFIPVENLILI